MVATAKHVYGRYTHEAIMLVARLVAAGRRETKMNTASLAERAGISRGTLLRLKNGAPKVEIGIFFKAASIVGVPLWGGDLMGLRSQSERASERLTVLPKYVREQNAQVNDDF